LLTERRKLGIVEDEPFERQMTGIMLAVDTESAPWSICFVGA